MIIIKTPEQIAAIKEGGKILASVLDTVIQNVQPGISTHDLDVIAKKMILEHGGKPSFEGYKPDNHTPPFPSTLCTSRNAEIVHTPASKKVILEEGDIISIDVGMKYKDCYTDMARTVAVGTISSEDQELLKVTEKSLYKGIDVLKPGASVYDVGKAIQEYVDNFGYGIVRDLVGHGVGVDIHEDPAIPNFIMPGTESIIFKEGMVIAIEPMLTRGTHEIRVLGDQWTIETADKSNAAHFEHTIIITSDGYEIATQ